jgi:hypothetical protein
MKIIEILSINDIFIVVLKHVDYLMIVDYVRAGGYKSLVNIKIHYTRSHGKTPVGFASDLYHFKEFRQKNV